MTCTWTSAWSVLLSGHNALKPGIYIPVKTYSCQNQGKQDTFVDDFKWESIIILYSAKTDL